MPKAKKNGKKKTAKKVVKSKKKKTEVKVIREERKTKPIEDVIDDNRLFEFLMHVTRSASPSLGQIAEAPQQIAELEKSVENAPKPKTDEKESEELYKLNKEVKYELMQNESNSQYETMAATQRIDVNQNLPTTLRPTQSQRAEFNPAVKINEEYLHSERVKKTEAVLPGAEFTGANVKESIRKEYELN